MKKNLLTHMSVLMSTSLILCGSLSISAETIKDAEQTTINIETSTVPTPQFTLENYPSYDGSLACIPLATALVEKLTGCTEMEAELTQDYLTNTNPCYLRLAEGDTDFILAYEASEETQESLKDYPELSLQAIGQDALVFLVNESNPVDSLTTEQLYGIFSGEIVNWSEVGGEDEEIRAFQRPENSGSQTLLRKLLIGDLEIPEKRIVKIESMEGIINEVMQYDNEANAIGFSVYYYAEEMMRKEGIKLLKISDAEPSAENIYNGTYPLVNPFYCGTSEKSSDAAREIQTWLCSEEGQEFVESCGYVRVSAK